MKNQSVDLDEIIDSRPIGALQWRVVLICFFLAVIDGFDASSIGYVAPILIEEFSISPDMMGQLISSALAGLMVGALFGSAIADAVGRKPVIVVSIVTMGVASILTAYSSNTSELFIYRFITGLGLGGVMPTINILTAEFAPVRRRALLMTLMFTGMPIGIVLGGLAAVPLIDQFGWNSVFLAGGILPLAMVPIVIVFLPESPRLLLLKPGQGKKLAAIVSRLAPDIDVGAQTSFSSRQIQPEKSGVAALFSDGRMRLTILLWIVFFANLLTIFGLMGWLPTVLTTAGFPLDRAILASVLVSVGGVFGGLAMALAIDRFGAILPMSLGFAAAAVIVSLVGFSSVSLARLLIVLFLSGFTTMGCQFGLNAMASESYETSARASGLGFALAFGRIGAIIGPILVGALLAMNLSIEVLFLLAAAPMLVASGAVILAGQAAAAERAR